MGQCSSSLGAVVETYDTPDPIMHRVAKSSLSTIQSIRDSAHQQQFGTKTKASLPSPPSAKSLTTLAQEEVTKTTLGQDHLLYQSQPEQSRESQSPRQLPFRNNHNHRKIAESFEASCKRNTDRPAVPVFSVGSHRNAMDAAQQEAILEDFEVGLSKRIGKECPTRLFLRRRPLIYKNRRKQKPVEFKVSSEDDALTNNRELVLLDSESAYRTDQNYFEHNPPTYQNGYPACQHSIHIYAIRHRSDDLSLGTEVVTSSDDDDSKAKGGDNSLLGMARKGLLTESPPSTAAKPKNNKDDKATTTAYSSNHTSNHSLNYAHADTDYIFADSTRDDNIFGPAQMALPPQREVVGWTTVSEEHSIYVVDIGLTPTLCDALVTTTEQACKGRYAAYTYAKQTLGCREFPSLARAALGPVHSMVSAILGKFDGQGPPKSAFTFPKSNSDKPTDETKDDSGMEKPPLPPKKQILQLDDREPHIVKYDLSKKERQKLDMHTDKSEWTFLIALSNGCGVDYDGGGTYFECLDATVHIQKGHALVFPGKLRHRGTAIISGLRFLLVGFLVDKGGNKPSKVATTTSTTDTSITPSAEPKCSCKRCGTPVTDKQGRTDVVLPSAVAAAS